MNAEKRKLKLKNTETELLPQLEVAEHFFSRLKGLLGTATLPEGQGLWIHRCNSIHTFFMKYTIDCIFLDADLRVVSLVPSVSPGRMVWPQAKADSVIEIAAGQLQKFDLKIGEQLYVGN